MLLPSLVYFRLATFDCDQGFIVVQKHPSLICVRGRCRLQVLAGEVQVMGYNLNKDSDVIDLYSPICFNQLTVTSVKAEEKVNFLSLLCLSVCL